jgi:catalase-peroxidase
VNNPLELAKVIKILEGIKEEFKGSVSVADLIVLGGCAAIEKAAANAGIEVSVPFAPGRTDATQDETDTDSFMVLEPTTDGFRNFLGSAPVRPAEETLVDRAALLTLTAPEMTVLVGGLRVLSANANGSTHGVLTSQVEKLTNDFFINVLDIETEWSSTSATQNEFEGRDRASGTVKWTATRNDLVFGSNSILRAVAEVYGASDAQAVFVRDFVAAWDKVMNLDRFDLG